jgi:O-antigen/teichoic acid export membrane protein
MLPIILRTETPPTAGRIADYVFRRLPIAAKSSLAILDQGLISGSNFLIGILLARWLAPDQYGAYATAYSIFLLVTLLYQALLLEPQSVFGASVYADRPREYLGSLFWLGGSIALLVIFILALWALVEHGTGWSPKLSSALVGVIAATPFILVFWLVRGACYTRLAPQQALKGALAYCLLVASALFLIHRRGLMSPPAAFVVMGAASAVATACVLRHFRRLSDSSHEEVSLLMIGQQHWNYGRWALATSVVVWIPGNIYYAVLGRHTGLAEAGELRALLNLFVPLGHTLSSLSRILLPYAAGKHSRFGHSGALERAIKLMFLFVGVAIGYWVVVILFRRPLFHLLYNGRFLEVIYLLPWLGLATILSFATLSFAISLRAMQQPSSVFVIYFVASIVCLSAGVPAAIVFGLRGVIAGLNLAGVSGFVTGFMLVRAKATTTAAAEQVVPQPSEAVFLG